MGFRLIVDQLYPNGFSDWASLNTWMRKLYDKLAKVEEWHEVGATNEPAFENSWANISTDRLAAFYKDPQGRVHLKGLIHAGSVGFTAFTLPAGYRPADQKIFAVISNGALGRVDVSNLGFVQIITPSTNNYVSLDGISFRAEQ